jgi:uncharacterized protein HemX
MTASELSGAIGTGILLAVAALAVVIAIATGLAKWVLERRRIASWETAWLSVGPRWSHQV